MKFNLSSGRRGSLLARGCKVITVFCISIALAGCVAATTSSPSTATQPPSSTQTPSAQIANPASENCLKQGGALTIRQRGDGGEYGICVFEDNRQCEEWAMLRGDCPVGGVKITGYVTPAAQYCAITGGDYKGTGNLNTGQEQGTCTFKNGATCDVWEYYNGKCGPDNVAQPSTYSDPFAYCAAVGTVDAPDARYNGPAMPDVITQALVRQGVVSPDAPSEFQQNAVWRCMHNQVWACHFGANLPCLEKADLSQKPTAEMSDFCKTNPTAESIPAAVTGRATVYEWTCKDGKPTAGRQIFQVDPQGYIAEFWYALTPQAAPPDAGHIYEPVPLALCQSLQEIAAQTLATAFTLEPNTPFTDPMSGETGLGCTLTAVGSGVDFSTPYQVKDDLVQAFVGWTEQPAYQAGGPTGEATGLTRDTALMLIFVDWKPAPEVNCPSDQPISSCDLKPEQKLYTVQIQVAQK